MEGFRGETKERARRKKASPGRETKKKVRSIREEEEEQEKIKRVRIPDDDEEEKIFRKLEEDAQINPESLRLDRVSKHLKKQRAKNQKSTMPYGSSQREEEEFDEAEGIISGLYGLN